MNDNKNCVAYQKSSRATWLEVDVAALRKNAKTIKAHLAPTTRFMAVVKGNAYGHDAVAVSPIFAQAGADWLAVATPGEGMELRAQGITLPILVLGYTPPWSVAAALEAELTLTVSNEKLINVITQAAHESGQPARIHVKVNTGMNRLGFSPDAVAPLLSTMQQRTDLIVEGLFTHFATADEPSSSFFTKQLQKFQAIVTDLTMQGLRPPLVHAANSAATLYQPQAHFDMVRCGIALYGLHPDPYTAPLPLTLQPALSWKAQVVQIRTIQRGESVGYGQAFVAKRAATIATIPIGYADGFPRSPQSWQCVLLHGEEVPLVGRVCMDQSMVDISNLLAQGKDVQVGDEVVLIGRQGQNILSAETIGERTGTINYEVVSRILPRVPRIMVGV